MDIVPEKQCTKCGESKPATTEYFRHRDKNKTAFKGTCKSCLKRDELIKRRAQGIPPNPSFVKDGKRCCSKCGEWKPETSEFFYYMKSRKKYFASCLDCARKDTRDRIRKWRSDHPEEARTKAKEDQREFRKRNADRLKIKNRDRRKRKYLENPELAREKGRIKYKQMMQTNPQSLRDKGIRNNHIRRERAVANTTTQHFTTADVKLHFKTQKGKCWWCGKKLDPNNYTIDHRIAIARGGSNAANNICISCPNCNFTKNDKLPSEWNGRLL